MKILALQNGPQNTNRVRADYFIFSLIFFLTGNPFFYWVLGKETQIILPVVIALSWAIRRRIKLTGTDLIVFVAFLLVVLVHFIEFGSATILSSLTMLSKIFIGLALARSIPDIYGKYISVMYWLSLLSLIFFIPGFMGLDMKNLFAHVGIVDEFGGVHILFHYFKVEGDLSLNRNMSFFGEPGIFAGFLIVAMLFALKNAANVPLRYFLVFITTLISTQSTTGYLIGFVVTLVWLNIRFSSSSSKNLKILQLMIKVLAVSGLLTVFVSVFSDLPFLAEKIQGQTEWAVNEGDGWELTRYGNAMFDLSYISERPLFGWSQLLETRNLQDEDFAQHQGNGLTGFAVVYGVFGLAIFIYFAYKTFFRFYKNKTIAAMVVMLLLILLNGEDFLKFPFFLSLLFLPPSIGRGSGLYLANKNNQLTHHAKFMTP